jgi:uncharacterized protein
VTHLLDGNVLVALAFPAHVHHPAAHAWRAGQPGFQFATCPITQWTLLRLALRQGVSAADARALLAGICALPEHQFWPDDVGYADVRMAGVLGHRQVTDAYLAELARRRSARLATLDRGLAELHPDVAVAVPVGPTP